MGLPGRALFSTFFLVGISTLYFLMQPHRELFTTDSEGIELTLWLPVKNAEWRRVVVAYAFNPSIWKAEASLPEFKVSLTYRVSSRTALGAERNPV